MMVYKCTIAFSKYRYIAQAIYEKVHNAHGAIEGVSGTGVVR